MIQLHSLRVVASVTATFAMAGAVRWPSVLVCATVDDTGAPGAPSWVRSTAWTYNVNMFALAGLGTALLFKGDVAATRQAFTIAIPLILPYDVAFRYADSAALLCVLEGRSEAAARMLGYAEAAGLAHGEDERERNETTARNKVIERLAKTEDPANVECWMREGAMLSDAEAYGLVLGEGPARQVATLPTR